MLDEKRYGEYYADGSKRNPEASALSGKPVKAGDGFVHVTLTPHHFVYVHSSERRALSRTDWDALKGEWKRQFENAAQPAAPDVVESDAPEFETMTVSELKQFASDNGFDISGLRTQAQLAQGIRAQAVMRQFGAPASAESVTAPTAPEGGI